MPYSLADLEGLMGVPYQGATGNEAGLTYGPMVGDASGGVFSSPGYQSGIPQIPQVPAVGGGATAALLSQILSSPMRKSDPRLAQLLAYNQLRQAMPARGPFTGLVNPIVAAIQAQRLGPAIQEQQDQAALKQRMEVLGLVSKISAEQASTRLKGVQATGKEAENEAYASIPLADRLKGLRAKLLIDQSPDAQLRAETAVGTAAAADERARLARENQVNMLNTRLKASADNLDLLIQSRADQHEYDQLSENQREIYRQQMAAQGRTFTESGRMTRAQMRAQQQDIGNQLTADIANIHNQIETRKLDLNTDMEQRKLLGGYVGQVMRYTETLDTKEEKNAYLNKTLGPTMKLLYGQDFKKMDPMTGAQDLWNSIMHPFTSKETFQTFSTAPGGGGDPSLGPPSPFGAPLGGRPPAQPIPQVTPGRMTLGPIDPSVPAFTPQENALRTPPMYMRKPGVGSTMPTPQPIPVPPPPVPTQMMPQPAPSVPPAAGVPAPTPAQGVAPDAFQNLFDQSDAYMGQ